VFTIISKTLILLIAVASVASAVAYNTNPSFAQMNNTQTGNGTDHTNFHSNIEQIIGHIQQAQFNKNANNDTLALSHTLHPIEEVLTLVTIPLSNADSSLNATYSNNLHGLSTSVTNSTQEQFGEQAQSSIDLSNQVISTVIPAETLNNTDHNITVIQDLLTIAVEEYAEGVQNGQIVMMLEYQDGSAFVDRASDLFNKTKSIVNEREEISTLFGNLTTSFQQLRDVSEIESTVEEINHELSESLSTAASATASETSAAGNSTSTTTAGNETLQYISNIRSLLDQTVSAYNSNDAAKARELATTAYLENFEHIERPIGEELSERGEGLLREQLRDQINANAPIGEIEQTISGINQVLDEAESSLGSQ
jgi:hypothetical protein